jgi:hypothetical protein
MSTTPTKSNDELKGLDFDESKPPAGYRKLLTAYDHKKKYKDEHPEDTTFKGADIQVDAAYFYNDQVKIAANLVVQPETDIILKFHPDNINNWSFWTPPQTIQYPIEGTPQFKCGFFKFINYKESDDANKRDAIIVKDLNNTEYTLELPYLSTTNKVGGQFFEIYIPGSPVAPAITPLVANPSSGFISQGLKLFRGFSSQPKSTGGKKTKAKQSSNKKTKGKNKKTKKQGKKSKK